MENKRNRRLCKNDLPRTIDWFPQQQDRHTHIHTYTHTYTCTHTHVLTHIRTHTHVHTHANTHTYIHIYTHIHTHIHTHTCAHAPAIAFLAITRACETISLPSAQYGWGRTSEPPDSDSESKNKFCRSGRSAKRSNPA